MLCEFNKMPGCSVPNCSQRSENGVRLYSLPRGVRNRERRKQWIININRKNLPCQAHICERHFTEDQFENRRQDKKRPLRWDAVPTMFSHSPSTKCRSTKIIAHPREPIDYVEDPFDEDTKTTDEAFNFLHDVKQTMIPGKMEAYNEEKLEVIKKEIEETFDCDKYGEIKTEYSYEIPTNGKLEEMGPEGKNPSTSSDATILRSMLSKGASKKKTNKTDKMLRKDAKKLHKEGEYSTFGQYIAGELEDMPTQMAIYCKRIVNEAILLAQIGHLNESSKIVSCFIDPLMVE